MNIKELFESPQRYIGQLIQVEGHLVSGNSTFLQAEESSIVPNLVLPHVLVQSTLLDHVPVYVGGAHLYSDSCLVKGVLSEANGTYLLDPVEIRLLRPDEPDYLVVFV